MGIIIIVVVVINVPSLPQSLSAKADRVHSTPLARSWSAADLSSPPAEQPMPHRGVLQLPNQIHCCVLSVWGQFGVCFFIFTSFTYKSY